MANLINQERANNGLPPYVAEWRLAAAARVQSSDIACRGWGSHTGSDGSSVSERVARQGYSAQFVAEIWYAGYSATPGIAFNWWMNSSIHRAMILHNNMTEFGVSYSYNVDTGFRAFIVVFAKPR